MFWGIATKRVRIPNVEIMHKMLDIQSLNELATKGSLEVTAISAAHYPNVADRYRIMSCGASVGHKYGPRVVAAHPMRESELQGATIAVPGQHTTSWMLYQIMAPPPGQAVFMNFDDVEAAIKNEQVDAGILLHEGQILYKERGFYPVLDLGFRWFEEFSLPIPLGLDLVSRSISSTLAQDATNALGRSIKAARANEDAALDYALQYGRGLSKDDARKFVRMYVNDDTEDMGQEGRAALTALFKAATDRGLLSSSPPLDIIQAH